MSECIEWTGYRNELGYGRRNIAGRLWLVHRWAWTEANGPIPDGMLVCHHCDNPPCINLDHLFLGTNRDNILDSVAKGRHVTPVHHGADHPNAKVNPHIVREIRRARANGVPAHAIAWFVGISTSLVYMIANRRRWAWVE